MEKASEIANVCAYATSCGSGGYWVYKLVNSFSPDQWVAIGVVVSIFFTALTYVTNLALKIYAMKNQRKSRSDKTKG